MNLWVKLDNNYTKAMINYKATKRKGIKLDCKHFGECGSCGVHDKEYEKQVSNKVETLSTLLNKFHNKAIDSFSSPSSNYRSRAEFRIWHNGDECSYAMGNMAKKGVVLISECPKVSKPIEERMWRLIEIINASKVLSHRLFSVEFLATTTDECLIVMLYHKPLDEEWNSEVRELEATLNANIIGRSRKQKVTISKEFVTEKLTIDNNEYLYRYYEGGFTQPNPAVNIKMIEWAMNHARSTNSANGTDLLELYCGLGNFTIPLSKLFGKVLATEISKNSINAAKENCELNDVNNIEFIRLSSEEMTIALNKQREFERLKGVDLDSYDFSCVLVDPPRAGLDDGTIKLITNIENIIYISCNPHTLARDLETITLTHEVTSAAMFDQFPHTEHMESGVFLRKLSKGKLTI
jgi:tRNA (uracil-5-)-methyltransferase